MALVSVKGDPNSHGGGVLQASNNTGKFTINGINVNYMDSSATTDSLLHPTGLTNASGASQKVFSEGIRVHRENDSRYCGAVTIVNGQNKVSIGE